MKRCYEEEKEEEEHRAEKMDKDVQKKEGKRVSYGKAEGRAAPGRRCRAGRPCR